ncbi:MAG: FtsX-like permease family protein, partial [Candidatus Heimdallarchaeota archaeon]
RISSDRTIKEITTRKRVLFIVFSSILTVIVLGVLLYYILKLRKIVGDDTAGFTTEQVRNSSYIIMLLLLVSFCLLLLLSIGLISLLGKSKKIFVKVFPKIGFVFKHNFVQQKSYLGILLFVILSFSFTTVFSLSLSSSTTQNEVDNAYYNNGADLRVQTLPVDYQFRSFLTAHEQIQAACPVFKLGGRVSTNQITIYGINPTVYGNIGRWDSSSFSKKDLPKEYRTWTSNELVGRLAEQPLGIIISDGLARKFGYEFDEIIRIDNIRTPIGVGSSQFIVVGIIHSAPGLGLASQASQFLDQPNDDFVLINEIRMISDYYVTEVDLFFAKPKEDTQINRISQDIQNMDYVLDVNPSYSLEGPSYEYIRRYFPNIQFFLNVNTIIVCIMGLLLISNFVNFIQILRERFFGILFSQGLSAANYLKLILVELGLLMVLGLVFGLSFGLLVVFLTFIFIPPLLKEPTIIPLAISFNPVILITLFAAIIFTAFVSLLPTIRKKSKKMIAQIEI